MATKVAVCQCPDIREDIEASFAWIEKFTKQAQAGNVSLICFPECFLQGYLTEELPARAHAINVHSPIFKNILNQLSGYSNQFAIDWDQVGKNDLHPFQFNLTYTPFVNNWAKFIGGKEYYTFDIHFTKEYLQKLAPFFPMLHEFLEQVEKGQPANLSEMDQFLTPGMITMVNQLLQCSFKIGVAKFYIEAKVMELLIMALDHVSGCHIIAPIKLSAYDVERLHEAKDILLSDFENKISLLQLSRKVGINDFKLKKGFKHLFGSTVFDYQQSAKMEMAMKELKETNKPVEEIAYSIGYDFVSNFNVAFKKHFGFPAWLSAKKVVDLFFSKYIPLLNLFLVMP